VNTVDGHRLIVDIHAGAESSQCDDSPEIGIAMFVSKTLRAAIVQTSASSFFSYDDRSLCDFAEPCDVDPAQLIAIHAAMRSDFLNTRRVNDGSPEPV
jgi:hypothetical protein